MGMRVLSFNPLTTAALWFAPVLRLVFRSGPAAIARFVITVRVNAIEGHSFGPFTHVRQEVREVFPSVANCNPAATVAVPITRRTNRASHRHAVPTHPSRSAPLSVLSRVRVALASLASEARRRLLHNMWITVFKPSGVVQGTHTSCLKESVAAFDGTRDSARLSSHRVPQLLGVWRLGVLTTGAAFIIILSPTPVSADHNVYLPLAGQTPLVKRIAQTQEYTWCINGRGMAYPGFYAQVKDSTDSFTRIWGIRNREVPYSSDCNLRHDMLDSHSCNGCAAWVHYANNPVVVEYKAAVGYVDWRTTISHELGHALGNLGEMYVDRGSIGCDSSYQGMINRLGFETVMSCGTGVKYPAIVDTQRACAILNVSWCGTDATQTCDRGSGDPRWDTCISPARWVFADGWSFDPVTGDWYNPQNAREWSACNGDRLRWNYTVQAWMPPSSAFYLPIRGYWSSAGPC